MAILAGDIIHRLLLWLDVKVLWVGTFGRCRPGETISSASWSLKLDGKVQGKLAVPIIDFLMRPFDGADHCQRAYAYDGQMGLYN